MIRPDSQNARILRALADGKPKTVPTIHRLAGTCRLNSRVAELRTHGYDIECERVAGRKGAAAYRYRLVSHPETLTQPGPVVSAADAPGSRQNGSTHVVDADAYAPRRPEERFRLYRVRQYSNDPELVATCESPAALGLAIFTLGTEGEFAGSCIGVMDSDGAVGSKWIVNPFDPPQT